MQLTSAGYLPPACVGRAARRQADVLEAVFENEVFVVYQRPQCSIPPLVRSGTDPEAVAITWSKRHCSGIGAPSVCEQNSEHDHAGAEGEVEPVVGGVERNEVGGFVLIDHQPKNP